jgi:hypothetical protein
MSLKRSNSKRQQVVLESKRQLNTSQIEAGQGR